MGHFRRYGRYYRRALFGLGVLFLGIGGLESRLIVSGTTLPQSVTLAALGEQRAVANVHVTVSQFSFGEGLVIESKDGRWTRVWVPLLLPDGSWTKRPVVAMVTGVQNDDELTAKINRPALTGVVTNGIFLGLGDRQREKFAEHYPQVNFSNAIALHIDRRFPSTLVTGVVLALGLISLASWVYLRCFHP